MKARGTGRVRSTLKGRTVDPQALAQVRKLLGKAPRRRDLLIEHLHRIQDAYGQLSAAHLAALAQELRMALAEVYEVATFYHHFDVVKDGAKPAAVTVRVCDSIACELAGSHELLHRLPEVLGAEVRVLHAPCVGRCEVGAVRGGGPEPGRQRDASRRSRRPSRPSRSPARRRNTSTTRPTARTAATA